MRAALFVLAIVIAGCGLLKKTRAGADAGADAAAPVIDAAAPDLDAAATPAPTVATPAPTASAPEPEPARPFQGTYKCSFGEMKVSQEGAHVTASHVEGRGAVAHVAQCTADGNKCAGSYRATDTKTMKSKGTGSVTIARSPKGDLTYKAGAQPATTCKKQP